MNDLGLGVLLWCITPLSSMHKLYRCVSVLLVEETRIGGENHRPAASH